MTGNFTILLWLMLCVSTPVLSSVLQKDNFRIPPSLKSDSASKDSIAKIALSDTSRIKTDSLKLNKTKGDGIQTSVKYTSNDSIVFDAETQTMKLYGDSKIDYGDMGLTAEQIDINWLTNNVDAHGVPDSNGVLKGMPLFKDKQDQYQTKRMIYNFKTKKGIISEVITKQGDGYIHGEKVKKNAANELFVTHSKYTTCNLAHPHFHISSSRIKMIPEKKVISGPFNLVINDVPTPLGFIFGFFPIPKHRSSGFVIPTYGESQNQGFYLQNGGFYWAANEHIGARFLADIYSLGGAGAQQITEYRNRYHYEGTLNFKYNWIKIDRPVGIYTNPALGPIDVTRKIDQHTFWLQWTHSTLSKKLGRLTANVNTGTSNYNQLNSRMGNTNATLGNNFQSSIQYSQTLRNTPFSYNLSLRQEQTVNGIKNFTLPDFNVAMNRVMPFQNVKGGKKTEIVRKFNLAYNLNLQNRLTNDSNFVGSKSLGKDSFQLADNKTWQKRGFYNYSDDFDYLTRSDKLNNGIRHSIPISTSVKFLKYFSLNPSMNYEEFWYNRSLTYKVKYDNSGKQIIDKDTIQGFSRANQYSFGTGITTRIYGTFFIRKGRIEALRHTLIPNIGYSYRPDFSETSYGYYEKLTLNNQTVYKSKYEGFVMGGPGMGKSSAINFSLNNNFELKVKEKSDSINSKKKFKKISLLDNLGISSAYNLAADSFNLTPIAFTARTKLFAIFDVAYSGSIDPYVRINELNSEGILASRRVNKFQWNNNQGIGNLTTSNLAFSFNLNSEKLKKNKKPEVSERASGIQAMSPEEEILRDVKNNPQKYLDFTIPWSMYVAYNLSYSQLYTIGGPPDSYNHSITYNGDISLSPNWKVQYSSGFNLSQKIITYTRFGITRDLHCWVMSLNWIPPIPGSYYASYNFQLNVKSSVLQDLKITKNRMWFDQ